MATGQKQVTIVDVAREAGVSRAAVSKVIRNAPGVSPAMHHRVAKAIDKLDYRPNANARAMRGSSFTLGLELPHLTNQFLSQVADSARLALADTPYQLILAPPSRHDWGALDALVDRRVDGIMAIDPSVETDRLEQLGQRVPLVMLGRHDQAEHYDTVIGDDTTGARAAMKHLLKLGHRRIAHITMAGAIDPPVPGTPHALRLQAYLEVMREAGFESFSQIVPVSYRESDAHDAALRLLDQDTAPTAIFAGHDTLALAALAAVAERGLTANDMSVVGYDNTSTAAHPLISLTSVDQSSTDIGTAAVRLLLERIDGRTEPRRHEITPTLITRASSAAPTSAT